MARSALRGPSADSLADLQGRLGDQVGSEELTHVGEELFAASGLLRSEPGLRRVATEVSTPAEAKQNLARGLFEGKLDQGALDLVAAAFGRRWTQGRDLPDALEHLGVEAVVRSAGDDAGRLSDELFTVGQLVNDDADLRTALSDPARSIDDKRGLLRGILEGKALDATVRLVEQALSGSHRTVSVAITSYQQIAADVHGESVAKVRTARELSDDERRRLSEALSSQYDRSVHLNVVVEPELLGGLRVEIGDDVIDGTIAARLDEARRKLAG